MSRPCHCGSGLPSSIAYDARGIPLGRTCNACHEKTMAKYRPEVLSNPNYDADEPIEPEDW